MNDYPEGKSPTTRVLAMPADVNANGDIFGGWIVSQIDIAGAIVAGQRARGRVVTVAINSVQFHKPVLVGDVLSFFATIEKIGRTSMTVKIEVCAERHPDIKEKVTEAVITYVAIDDERRPCPVPPE